MTTTPARYPRLTAILLGPRLALILACGGAALIVWLRLGGNGGPPRAEPDVLIGTVVSLAGGESLGRSDAPEGLLLLSDFECTACTTFARETWPAVRQRYIQTGLVRMVLRHYPLSIHPSATALARLALCASEQGRFWDLYSAAQFLSRVDRALFAASIQRTGGDPDLFLGHDVSTRPHTSQSEATWISSRTVRLIATLRICCRGPAGCWLGWKDRSG